MNSKQKGNITEIHVIASLMDLGLTVLFPYGDSNRYDFVCDVDGHFYRIQSKTAKSDDGGNSFKINCRSSHRRGGRIVHHKYTKKEIDYFATYYKGQGYLIPVEKCGGDKRFRLNPPKNNADKNITWAKQYTVEEVIKSLQEENV